MPDMPAPIVIAAEVLPLTLTGTLRNAATLYPLQGLHVQALYVEPPHAPGAMPPPPRLLGSATSSADGTFAITGEPGPGVTQLLCLLADCAEAEYTVTVSISAELPASGANAPGSSLRFWHRSGGRAEDAAPPPLLTTAPASTGGRAVSLNLLVPIPARGISPAQWSDLGARVRTSGIVTLNGVIDQLARVPVGQSIFRDWPVLQRQNAVMQLETAFLDPHNTLDAIAPLPAWQKLEEPGGLDAYRKTLGDNASQPNVQAALNEARQKLDAFPELPAVDWQIDPTQFERSPAEAITANQGKYFGPFPRPVPIPTDFAPELGYRDYLRIQWTSIITLVEYVRPHSLTVAQAAEQLRNRLHQDFTTPDLTNTTANEILIPILIEILTATPGTTFGFGIPAASIPARGGATAREYLNRLIGLSRLSAQELTLRYRIDFTRSDTAQSSAVWENIHTLQGFFRDSFQSVVDPARTDPDVLGQPIIPDKMQGKAPFFLEYDEWLLLQQPIPFENYVQIRAIFHMVVSADNRQLLANYANSGNRFQAASKFFVAARWR